MYVRLPGSPLAINGRLPSPVETVIDADLLYHEQLVVVAGPRSKWLRQRRIVLADLANECWHPAMPFLISSTDHHGKGFHIEFRAFYRVAQTMSQLGLSRTKPRFWPSLSIGVR